MYVTVPSPLFTRVPSVGPVTMLTVAGSMVPSRSVSLPVRSTVTGVSSGVVSASATAIGASLTSSTPMVTVAIFEVAPSSSCTVYVKLSLPL